MSDSLWPHEPQHARPPCPSPTPRVYSNSCPQSQWCHPIFSSSVIPSSSCLQSFPASGSFQINQFFPSSGQSIRVSASASVFTIKDFLIYRLMAPISPPLPGRPLATRRTKRYGASNANCHWRSPGVYEASIARWCLLFSLNRESKKEAQLWRALLFLFLVFCCLPSTSILENHWREKTMKCCFLEMTMKAFITAILLRA